VASITILRPGMLTTVQDLGRWGYQGHGVPVAGPMDVYSHRLANQLVGNRDTDAALEVTLIGPEFEADAEIVCAVAGADFEIAVNGSPARLHQRFAVPAGGRVRFGPRRSGARATIAVHGGIDVPPSFGSRATSVSSRMGPFGGRPLVPGDVLAIASGRGSMDVPDGRPMPMPSGGARVRVMLGPHEARFTADAIATLLRARFVVSPQSNRMGYRLDGPSLRRADTADLLSDATPIGSLQVPGSGEPILLMADRQTTGGYPKIATVISADLPVAGQLAPGDWIEFAACGRDEALAALRDREAALSGAVR
jgi:antagonist of KipI